MIGTLVLLSCLALGVSPEEGSLRSEVEQLVAQLNAPQLARRQTAEEQLLRHGPAVLDVLPSAAAPLPAETRQRLARVRQKLEQQAAESVLTPSLISLHADMLPLSDILVNLQRQSGNRLIDARGQKEGSDPRLPVDFSRVPFWVALEHVLKQTRLALDLNSSPQAIGLIDAPNGPKSSKAMTSYSGPFRFNIAGVDARAAGTTVVSVQVAWEPRVHVISLSQRMAMVAAEADDGAKVRAVTPAAQLEIPTGTNAIGVRFDVPLDTSNTKQLAQLSGTLNAIVAGKREAFRFTDLPTAQKVDQRIASATVTLEGIRKTDGGYEVRLRVRFDDAGEALASHRTWIFNNPAYLETAEGKRIRYKTFETTRQEQNEVGVAFLFETSEPLGALRFVYQTPVAIFNREFAYTLRMPPAE